MRIGILGGTYDPIHEGHLALARASVEKLRLNLIIFIPAYRHPLADKETRTLAPPEARLEMVRLATRGNPKFEVSDCEIKRKGCSYTVDTLREFRLKYPVPDELFFVTGGDWGKNLNQWKEIDTIFSLAHFVVARRPGFDTSQLPKQVEFLDFAPLDISSTEIRQQLRKGGFQRPLMSQEVLNYIREHGLYRS